MHPIFVMNRNIYYQHACVLLTRLPGSLQHYRCRSSWIWQSVCIHGLVCLLWRADVCDGFPLDSSVERDFGRRSFVTAPGSMERPTTALWRRLSLQPYGPQSSSASVAREEE